jgi:ferredoxin-NADP reductase
VLYRVASIADAVLLRELQELCRWRRARLHVLTKRTGRGNPPLVPFDLPQLSALVPDIPRDVFVFGPTTMTEAVLRMLKVLRAGARRAVQRGLGGAEPTCDRRSRRISCASARNAPDTTIMGGRGPARPASRGSGAPLRA